MKTKIPEMQAMASKLVGDGKSPQLYFVTDEGVCVTITRNFSLAYAEWNALSQRFPLKECALEGRKIGTISSVEPTDDEPGAPLERIDDAAGFGLRPNTFELVC